MLTCRTSPLPELDCILSFPLSPSYISLFFSAHTGKGNLNRCLLDSSTFSYPLPLQSPQEHQWTASLLYLQHSLFSLFSPCFLYTPISLILNFHCLVHPCSAGMAQHSGIARSAIMTNAAAPEPSRSTENNKPNGSASSESGVNGASHGPDNKDATLMPPPKYPAGRASNTGLPSEHNRRASKDGVGVALSDTPMSTAPSSPQV